MPKLVCIDVDGTLVGTGGVVPPAVWAAAARARARGIRLAICSGRPAFGLAREYAGRLDAEGWHAFNNGASVLHVGTDESRSAPLPADAVSALVATARAAGRDLELYTDAGYVVESRSDRARRHAGLLGVPFRPRPLESIEGAPVRAQWLMPHAEAAAVLREPNAGLHAALSTSPVMPDSAFVNLTPAGVDKASAVRALAALYRVPLAEVMMVGDAHNDLGVLAIVGHPVAMGNAEPEVHAAARRRVGHVDAGGLAEALELAVAAGGVG